MVLAQLSADFTYILVDHFQQRIFSRTSQGPSTSSPGPLVLLKYRKVDSALRVAGLEGPEVLIPRGCRRWKALCHVYIRSTHMHKLTSNQHGLAYMQDPSLREKSFFLWPEVRTSGLGSQILVRPEKISLDLRS